MSVHITSLLKQFIKYFGVALVGYVFDFGTLVILTSIFHVYYLISASAGFVIGLIIVYILSGKYVFGESKIKSRLVEFGLFLVIGLIGLGILNGCMFALTSGLGMSYIIAKIIGTIFVYIWNFGARRALYHN